RGRARCRASSWPDAAVGLVARPPRMAEPAADADDQARDSRQLDEAPQTAPRATPVPCTAELRAAAEDLRGRDADDLEDRVDPGRVGQSLHVGGARVETRSRVLRHARACRPARETDSRPGRRAGRATAVIGRV